MATRTSLSTMALIGIAVVILLTAFVVFWQMKDNDDRCRTLSDESASEMAISALHRSFGQRSDDMLGGRTADQVRAARVSRDEFGKQSQHSSINVHFSDTTTQNEVIVARIFPECEIEWRPNRN